MHPPLPSRIIRKALILASVLAGVITAGTAGYWLIGGGRYSLLDCLYMTFITVSTIGYGEIIDLSGSPAGRLFTMALAAAGIGVMTYILVNFTAFVVEGELNETFRRKRMEKAVREMDSHYIVCGLAGAGSYILRELRSTDRPHVLVESTREEIERGSVETEGTPYIEGDATDSDTLLKAGVARARGLFAVTGDDNQNLVVSLTAKGLNPALRIIASCKAMKNADKMRKAGADAIVSPTFIGGLRMASEMIRPSVVSFLDVMLREEGGNLRIEELTVPAGFGGRPLSDLNLQEFEHLLLLALRSGEKWHYNPPRRQILNEGDILIFMTSPEERRNLEEIFSGRV